MLRFGIVQHAFQVAAKIPAHIVLLPKVDSTQQQIDKQTTTHGWSFCCFVGKLVNKITHCSIYPFGNT